MDLQVRYWCNKTSRAVTRYCVSEFQMHDEHMTLSENFLKGIGDLPEEKLTQTAMDGPNVNWKVPEIIQIKREEDEYPPLQDIGRVACMWSVEHFTQPYLLLIGQLRRC